jgi:hypothetical protein
LEKYTKIVPIAVQSATLESNPDHTPPGKFPSFTFVTNAGKSKKKAQTEAQHECASSSRLESVEIIHLKTIKYACTSTGATADNAAEIDKCANKDISCRKPNFVEAVFFLDDASILQKSTCKFFAAP